MLCQQSWGTFAPYCWYSSSMFTRSGITTSWISTQRTVILQTRVHISKSVQLQFLLPSSQQHVVLVQDPPWNINCCIRIGWEGLGLRLSSMSFQQCDVFLVTGVEVSMIFVNLCCNGFMLSTCEVYLGECKPHISCGQAYHGCEYKTHVQ